MARRDLPPLRALTAFEASARLGSFRLAGKELGITRSAVSHQVKALEEHLGVPLFHRDARRSELTSAGQMYFPPVREALDQLEAQTRAIRPQADDDELTVQVYVTVALKWLIPQLHDFERRFQDLRVRLYTAYFDWDYDARNIDVGLVLPRNRSPEHYYRTLFHCLLTPVCSPALMRGANALRKPQDLRKHKLLYVHDSEEDWFTWLAAAGIEGVKLSDRLAFDSYILAQQAAVEGRGVVMTIGPFATEELRSGALVQPFPLMVKHRNDWMFACKAEHRMKAKIRRFEDWLVRRIAADAAFEPYRYKARRA